MNGSIYRITCLENPKINYIGSTLMTLTKRWQSHKDNFKQCLKNPERRQCSIFPFMKEYGLDKFIMLLIKEYIVVDKDHLKVYEQLHINKYRINNYGIVNKSHCLKGYSCKFFDCYTQKKYAVEHKEELKEYMKNYALSHKEALKAYQKEYNTENAETLAVQRKQYRDEHKEVAAEYSKVYREEKKEELQEKKKIYREQNKEKIKERKSLKIDCECGSTYCQDAKSKHERSAKHQYFVVNGTIKVNKTPPQDKITCICGVTFVKSIKSKHEQSKGHIAFVQSVNSICE